MNLKSLFHRFFHFLWFFALPAAVAWGLIDALVRTGTILEMEIWYVLLVFVLLSLVMYGIRDKLPFWRDLDSNSPLNRMKLCKDAAHLIKNVRKIMSKKGHLISATAMAELNEAIDALATAMDKDAANIDDALKTLDKKSSRHLARFRKSAVREYFETIGIAVLIAVLLRLFVFEAFKIPSESMVPTLMVGDHIFVSKYRYGLSIPFSNKRIVRFAKPDYGEVIVFVKPSREEQKLATPAGEFFNEEYEMVGVDFIKRIVALPGDTISMARDVVYVNGKPIPRCNIGKQTYRTKNPFGGWVDHSAELWLEKHGEHTYTIIEEPGDEREIPPTTVPEDQVFVLGDNRDNSRDSRYWGAVPFDNIKGLAMYIWWSNRRPYGFQWDRVGKRIMKDPVLTSEQEAALSRCPNMR